MRAKIVIITLLSLLALAGCSGEPILAESSLTTSAEITTAEPAEAADNG